MRIHRDHSNVALLAVCQALFFTTQTMHLLLAGLAGQELADNKALATLPVTTAMLATMLTAAPASLWMKRIGRRAGFSFAVAVGAIGAAIAAWAIELGSFWLFAAGTFVYGVYGGFAQFYRFAAADVARPEFKSKAISLVVSGGIVAAVLGPQLGRWSADWFLPIPFLGAYVAMTALTLAALVFLAGLDIPPLSSREIEDPGRPLAEIMRQPVFLVAVLSGMVGYGVMSLVMTATPLAMLGCGFVVGDAAVVIQWHVLGMFAPSLVTGTIINRFGLLNVMLAGVVLLLASVAVALAGIRIENFVIGLVALGLGWNFTFIGASTLLTEAYRPAERAKAQAANDLTVFTTVVAASLSSGAVLHYFNWNAVTGLALPFVLAAGAALLWLRAARRRTAAA